MAPPQGTRTGLLSTPTPPRVRSAESTPPHTEHHRPRGLAKLPVNRNIDRVQFLTNISPGTDVGAPAIAGRLGQQKVPCLARLAHSHRNADDLRGPPPSARSSCATPQVSAQSEQRGRRAQRVKSVPGGLHGLQCGVGAYEIAARAVWGGVLRS